MRHRVDAELREQDACAVVGERPAGRQRQRTTQPSSRGGSASRSTAKGAVDHPRRLRALRCQALGGNRSGGVKTAPAARPLFRFPLRYEGKEIGAERRAPCVPYFILTDRRIRLDGELLGELRKAQVGDPAPQGRHLGPSAKGFGRLGTRVRSDPYPCRVVRIQEGGRFCTRLRLAEYHQWVVSVPVACLARESAAVRRLQFGRLSTRAQWSVGARAYAAPGAEGCCVVVGCATAVQAFSFGRPGTGRAVGGDGAAFGARSPLTLL